MPELIVMKFGGTSLGNATKIRDVAKIVAEHRERGAKVVVVVSAMSGVTNLLVSAAAHAIKKAVAAMNADLARVHDIHAVAIADLRLPGATSVALQKTVETHIAGLQKLLESISELSELTPRAHDLVVSFGERINIHLVASCLAAAGVAAEPVEATRLIVTSDHFSSAAPDLEASEQQTKPIISKLLRKGVTPVVTGFIGATPDGILSTLGRGGSDYSATILGYCLDATAVQIWTDVNGVMTADPRIVPDARTLDALSYNEAAEMSYFGAKVLHPLTMVPAVRKNLPIWIKNTFNPSHPGTKISAQTSQTSEGGKAISTMRGLALITVQGRGMLGVPGIAGKVFGAVATSKINVLFISQASSEFNISFVVPETDGTEAVAILRNAFRLDIMDKAIETITAQDKLAIVAVVGEGMKGQTGVAGKIFSALGDAGINIRAIAQGSSERNISLVIADADVPDAVRSIHHSFQLTSV